MTLSASISAHGIAFHKLSWFSTKLLTTPQNRETAKEKEDYDGNKNCTSWRSLSMEGP